MTLHFYDDYNEEDFCAFCGDDGKRYGLVAAINCDVKLPKGSITATRLKPLIKNLDFEKEELEFFLERHPNAKIEITE